MFKINVQRVIWMSILSVALTACGGGGDDGGGHDMPVGGGSGVVDVADAPVTEGIAFAQRAVRETSLESDEPRSVEQAQMTDADTDEPNDNI